MSQTVQEIRNYYEGCFNDKSSRYSQMMNNLLKNVVITPNSRVLDYGSGTGLVSHYLFQKHKCKIDAVDISRECIEGAREAWQEDDINWIELSQFDFPENEYDLIISSQVIEHIHNVGNYLCKINKMLRKDGLLMIGLPNTLHLAFLVRQLRCKEANLIAWSKEKLKLYDKGTDHINAWDTYHFVTLLSSCGFQLTNYLPTEGVVIPGCKFLNKILSVRKYVWGGTLYIDKMNKGFLKNLCYTQYFLFKKERYINIKNTD